MTARISAVTMPKWGMTMTEGTVTRWRVAQGHVSETLPDNLLQKFNLIGKRDALGGVHFPSSLENLNAAQSRLKFEELFYLQLRLLKLKLVRYEKFKGKVFNDTTILTQFYKDHLPFELTEAQKKVIREIYQDMKSGHQMSRLLQGDVGSGKTIVAFICMLPVETVTPPAAAGSYVVPPSTRRRTFGQGVL